MKVLKEFEFDAAHYLPSYNGKCEHLHGHTYRLVAEGCHSCVGNRAFKNRKDALRLLIEQLSLRCEADSGRCSLEEHKAQFFFHGAHLARQRRG